ncbi:MAG TPA: hypothetical protein VJ850_10020 [Candidatus Limnocylindrales bacterium]|nr:hypothetical protein [Candidatus Limnocylindrales bacterium]
MPDRKRPPDPDGLDGGEGAADEAALAIVARHALHEEELVAALAAGALDNDDDADDRARARGLVDRCPACRAVHDDVAAIVGATRNAAQFTAKAPRDYRLTVDDAHRLGGTVITRGPVAALGRMVASFARPLGASVAALGLVGVLVGSAVLGATGVTQRQASDAGTTSGGAAASGAPAAAPSSLQIEAGPDDTLKSTDAPFVTSNAGDDATAAPASWILLVSGIAVVLGLALFVYGVMAGRRGGSRAEAP